MKNKNKIKKGILLFSFPLLSINLNSPQAWASPKKVNSCKKSFSVPALLEQDYLTVKRMGYGKLVLISKTGFEISKTKNKKIESESSFFIARTSLHKVSAKHSESEKLKMENDLAAYEKIGPSRLMFRPYNEFTYKNPAVFEVSNNELNSVIMKPGIAKYILDSNRGVLAVDLGPKQKLTVWVEPGLNKEKQIQTYLEKFKDFGKEFEIIVANSFTNNSLYIHNHEAELKIFTRTPSRAEWRLLPRSSTSNIPVINGKQSIKEYYDSISGPILWKSKLIYFTQSIGNKIASLNAKRKSEKSNKNGAASNPISAYSPSLESWASFVGKRANINDLMETIIHNQTLIESKLNNGTTTFWTNKGTLVSPKWRILDTVKSENLDAYRELILPQFVRTTTSTANHTSSGTSAQKNSTDTYKALVRGAIFPKVQLSTNYRPYITSFDSRHNGETNVSPPKIVQSEVYSENLIGTTLATGKTVFWTKAPNSKKENWEILDVVPRNELESYKELILPSFKGHGSAEGRSTNYFSTPITKNQK